MNTKHKYIADRQTWFHEALLNGILEGERQAIANYAIKDIEIETIRRLKIPGIAQVIFNDPATVIIWCDNTKTVVKCQPGDAYDKEKGFLAAYMKRLLGNDNTFNKVIKRWVQDE